MQTIFHVLKMSEYGLTDFYLTKVPVCAMGNSGGILMNLDVNQAYSEINPHMFNSSFQEWTKHSWLTLLHIMRFLN